MRLRTRHPWRWGALLCLTACLYDAGDRCGEHQEYQDGKCVCAEGYVLSGAACEKRPAPADAASDDASVDDDAGAGDGGRPPYTGQKEPCTSHGDCAGYDATYCNPVFMQCMVQGCTADSCDPGYMCIDLGMYIPGEPAVCLDPADVPR